MNSTERLTALRDALIADAQNTKGVKFDLGSWLKVNKNDTPTISCSTFACAVGLACLLPEFQAEGLEMSVDDMSAGMSGREDKIFFSPKYGSEFGFDAAAAFFGLSHAQAALLFDPVTYDDEHHTGANAEYAVAERIADVMDLSPTAFRQKYEDYLPFDDRFNEPDYF